MNPIRVPVLLWLVWLLTACSSPAPLPVDAYYDLQPRVRLEPVSRPVAAVLWVQRPVVDDLRGVRNLVYSPDGRVKHHYNHHFWADQPARMLHRALLRQLERSGLFSTVLERPPVGLSTARLEAELLRLDRVRSGEGWKVDVALRFRYFHPGAAEPAFTHGFHRKTKLRDERMSTTVEAYNRLTGEAISELIGVMSP